MPRDEMSERRREVGETLRDLRGVRSARTVCAVTGMSRDTLRRAEDGKPVEDVTYRRLEAYYGVRPGMMQRILDGRAEAADVIDQPTSAPRHPQRRSTDAHDATEDRTPRQVIETLRISAERKRRLLAVYDADEPQT